MGATSFNFASRSDTGRIARGSYSVGLFINLERDCVHIAAASDVEDAILFEFAILARANN